MRTDFEVFWRRLLHACHTRQERLALVLLKEQICRSYYMETRRIDVKTTGIDL